MPDIEKDNFILESQAKQINTLKTQKSLNNINSGSPNRNRNSVLNIVMA